MGSNPERRQPAHGNAVRDSFRTLESLTEAADAVRSLLAHPGWAHVSRLLDAEIAKIDARLDGDRLLETRSEYAHLHGQRRGLRAALGIAHAIVSYADERLERERQRYEGGADASLREAA